MFSFILAIWISICLPVPQLNEKGALEIRISNAKSDRGKIRVLLFSSETGFPDQPEKALKSNTLDPKDKSCDLIFEDLPLGRYAISVIHDEDNDGKMTTNFFGYPSERFGFSNNPKIYLEPPAFEKAAFDLKSKTTQVLIELH